MSLYAPRFLTRPEAANYLRVSPKTLAKWAWAGMGPDYFRVGGRVAYDKSDLETWLERQRRSPEEYE